MRKSSLIGVLVVAAGLAGCHRTAAAPAGAAAGRGAPQAIPVSVEVAEPQPVADTSTFVASIQSRDSMVISPLVSGLLTKILVRSGDQVAAGAPLMQIDPSAQEAAVAASEKAVAAEQATLNYDKQQLDRMQTLYQEQIESQQDYQSALSTYDNAVAQLAALQAQVRQQQVTLGYYAITAPRAGVIGDIPVKVGDQVTPATELTTLDEDTNLELYVQVPIEQAGLLRMGLPIAVLDSNGQTIANTTIDFISPQVDNTTQTILVKADLAADPAHLRTQQYVQARITWGTHPAFLVPVLAVSQLNGRFFVFLAQPTGNMFTAHEQGIEVGNIVGNNYEVHGGLTAGDRVIVSSVQILAEGMPVMPLPAGAPNGRGPDVR